MVINALTLKAPVIMFILYMYLFIFPPLNVDLSPGIHDHFEVPPDLNDAVAAAGHHQTSGRVHVHVADVVFPLVERSQWCSTEATQTHTIQLAKITAANH